MQKGTANVAFPALLTAGLVATFSGFFAHLLIPESHEHVEVYKIEVSEEGAAEEVPAGPAPIAPMMAAADPVAGAAVANACKACHSFEQGGANKTGPNLWGVVGADHGHMEGFKYSQALTSMEGPWSYEALNAFLYAPKAYAPGTKMAYAGIKDDADRANVIAYLRSLSDAPMPLPDPAEAAPPEGEGEGADAGAAPAAGAAADAGGAAPAIPEAAAAAAVE